MMPTLKAPRPYASAAALCSYRRTLKFVTTGKLCNVTTQQTSKHQLPRRRSFETHAAPRVVTATARYRRAPAAAHDTAYGAGMPRQHADNEATDVTRPATLHGYAALAALWQQNDVATAAGLRVCASRW
ncbi:hypothetical protein TNCT_435601 [Trichonephila clavata]|uniref:Uncharacterized protein n=1 Tax=Trichonephila clavata TaxID=2740835 RepID=A0A8X6J585_TRICU|nr:hypothetical protein TNCT_435601 [Trichonephila clavata]